MPKKLLISGCSYGVVYSDIEAQLKTLFDVDHVVNISQNGASPDRQMRGVIEWIAQHGKPDMIILPVSYAHRFDLPIGQKVDPYHNKHYRMTWQMILGKKYGSSNPIDPRFPQDMVQTFLKTGTMIHENGYLAHDDLWTRLIMFQAYLEHNGIRHLIFDTGNYYEKVWTQKHSAMEKRKLVEQCKGIYKFFTFCSNVWMYNTMTDQEKKDYIPWYKPQTNKPIGKIIPDTEAAILHHNKFKVVELLEFLKAEGAVHG